MRRLPLVTSVLTTMLIASACSGGNGIGPIVGKWHSDDGNNETVEFLKDGTTSAVAGDGTECTGSVKREDKDYRVTLDCAIAKFNGTAKLSSDKKRLTITTLDGDSNEYVRAPG